MPASGLVKLGHVALDGTKLKANASKHKAMSYGQMKKAEAELQTIVSGWLRQAQAADAREDEEHGADQSGEELPDWVRDKQGHWKRSEKPVLDCKLKRRHRRARKAKRKRVAVRVDRERTSPVPPRIQLKPTSPIPKAGSEKPQRVYSRLQRSGRWDADSQVIVAQGLPTTPRTHRNSL